MNGNPYSAMISMMRGEGAEQSSTGETANSGLGAQSVKMRIGTVKQTLPLQVAVAGVTMPPAALRLNESLSGGEQMEITLKVGDAVLLLTGDDQVFYVVMKVVAAI